MVKDITHNKLNRISANNVLSKELFKRTVLSFYKYVEIKDVNKLRDFLFSEWSKLGVLGRIYVAKEGINAQVSVPEHHVNEYRHAVDAISMFKNIPFKQGFNSEKQSFYKLTIKVKDQIVADGLKGGEFDLTNIGNKLGAADWNKKMEKGAVVVDMRNHYESEVGHFSGAVLPQSVTFREELPMVIDLLKGKEEEEILLYCTGGIRCEKASAYLKHKGFKSVNQLNGGIINYTKTVRENGLENKFKGKNFVFDDRLGERISKDVVSNCHQCGSSSDHHTNCSNLNCNLLFIQCENCAKNNQGCCSPECISVFNMPLAKQKNLRSNRKKKEIFHSHKKIDLSLKFNR